jgi:hypothetical protein
MSLQCIKREIRQTVCHEYYNDLDVENAHPVILQHLCKQNNIKCPYLDTYIKDRDKVLSDTKLNRDDAKRLYLIIMNMDEFNGKLVNKHMTGFKNEMDLVHDLFYNMNPEIALQHTKNRNLKKKYTAQNPKASYVNSLMCNIENEILQKIIEFYGNPNDCVLCFDGVMLNKSIDLNNIDECEQYIFDNLGINIKLKIKDMIDIIDLSKYEQKSIIDDRVYKLCKALPEFNYDPSFTFNRAYVSELDKSYLTDLSRDNILIKSDTGTGKTHTFGQYIKDTNQKFISIGSRISLVDDQYKNFVDKFDTECIHYNHCSGAFKQKQNIFVMLDSILRCRELDFSEYVIYLDEISFLIEYLHNSSTMHNNRILINRMFCKMITTCKQLIGTDADINSVTLCFLDYLKIDYVKHQNLYNHAKGVKSIELKDRCIMIEKLKTLDKYMICCDSKIEAKSLYNDLNDKTIKLYVSGCNKKIDLDADKVIFSPTVITGVDSLLKRNVFCIYKERTINSFHMVQQLNRCRNIINLYYLFPNKRLHIPQYDKIDDVYEVLDERHDVFEFETLATTKECLLYRKILAMILYRDDCINTNKFLHFRNILKDRGIEISDKHIINKNINLKTRKDIIQQELEHLDIEKMKDKIEPDGSVRVGTAPDINSILAIPDDRLNDYKQYLVDDILLGQHFNICNFYFKNNLKNKLENSNDFNINRSVSSLSKMVLLKKIVSTFNINTNNMIIQKNVSKNKRQLLANEFKTVFKKRDRDVPDFTENDNIQLTLIREYRSLF